MLFLQVDEMEKDVPLQKIQLEHATKERDSLLKQIEMLNTKLVNTEGQFSRERTKSCTLQVRVYIT